MTTATVEPETKTPKRSPRAQARAKVYHIAWVSAKARKLSDEDRKRAVDEACAEFDRLNPMGVDLGPEGFNFPAVEHVASGRIHWDPKEMKDVAINLAAKMHKQGLRHVPDIGDKTGVSLVLDFLRVAQAELLPKNRRRIGPSVSRGAFHKSFWAMVEVALTAKEKEIPPTQAPIEKAAPIVEASPPAPEEEKLKDIPLAKLLQYTLGEVLGFVGRTEAQGKQLQELSDWRELFISEVEGLRKEVGELRAQVANNGQVRIEIPKKVLPRVAIVACQRYMFEHITRGAEARGIKCEWHHYDQDEAPKKVHAEWAISLRWGGHGWDDQLKICIPNPDRRTFISGGTAEAIKQLEAWFAVPHS